MGIAAPASVWTFDRRYRRGDSCSLAASRDPSDAPLFGSILRSVLLRALRDLLRERIDRAECANAWDRGGRASDV